jgi:hypothetical protein
MPNSPRAGPAAGAGGVAAIFDQLQPQPPSY